MRKDLRFALRGMAANPGVTVAAVLTLALGIGANTAMFSVIHAVLLNPLPVADPGRLTMIWARIPRMNIANAFVEYNTFAEWRAARSFESLAAYTPTSGNLAFGDQPERLKMLRVTSNFLAVCGVRPAIGRDFLPEEDQPGGTRVAILSDALWKKRFGAERSALGRSIAIDSASYAIVGVLPREFDLVTQDLLVPIAQSTARAPGAPTVGVYARLKPAVTVAAAQAEIDNLSRAWARQYQYPNDWGARVWPIRDFLVRYVAASIAVLTVAGVLVLLMACANVANLLLARAGARQREIAVRSALGAHRGRIVRQLLTESMLVGAAAAGIGLLVAWAAVRALATAQISLPFLKKVAMNPPVLGFTVAAALVTTLLFGTAPALAASRTDLAEDLKEGGRGTGESAARGRFRAGLVVVEIALALLLGIGATLTIRSLANLQAVNPGFNPEAILTTDVVLPASTYAAPSRRVEFFRSLLEKVAAAPGVAAAGMATNPPFSGSKSGNDVRAEGGPPPKAGENLIAFFRSVDPGYFNALRVRLVRGRYFTEQDPAGSPVAIVNEAMARRLWPGLDPVGKRFTPGGRSVTWLTIVGVVSDVKSLSLADPPDLEYYLPYRMSPAPAMSLVVRSSLDAGRLNAVLRAAVRELDRELPVSEVTALSESIARSTSARRFSVAVLSAFAGLALLLAAVGIYGVVAHSVTRRTHEIGVRMSLGADPRKIAGMVLGRTLILGGAGVAIGAGGGLALTRLLRSMLYGVSATDPLVFAAASALLLAVASLAAYVPARRAARVDPLVALRHE
jgi:putative ABC transport system permease protein